MSLTTTDVERFVTRRLDGQPSVSIASIRDRAGEFSFGCHPWSWLVRKPASLSLSAGSDVIRLPSGFGRFAGQPKPTDTNSLVTLELVSQEELLAFRASLVSGGPNYKASLSYGDYDGEGTIVPRLDVWPTPTVSESNAFSLPYLAGWVAPSDDADKLPMPSWFEGFFLDCCFAVAQGYDEHDLGSVQVRLEEILNSREFRMLQSRDGGVQPYIGRMRGGAWDCDPMFGEHAAVGIATRTLPPS